LELERLILAKNKTGYSKAAENRIKNFSAKQSLQGARSNRRRRDNLVAITASAIAVVFSIGSVTALGALAPTPSPSVTANSEKVPDKSLAENRTWTGTISINNEPLTVELDGKKAPQAVANFVSLAKEGFFDEISCHRLTTEGIFVLQCGDPAGDGTGGPGYSWGPIENAPADDTYQTGTLAMARQGGNASSMGSQFFIVYNESVIPSDAAGGYTVFGKITGGVENLKPIIIGGVSDGSGDGKPALPTTINSIQVK
jgi:peptidyl-prolyl cis-trans isomerase B (cyclophilin B)